MSVHTSLKTTGSLGKHRNVLSRAERLAKLEEAGLWKEGVNKALGLPKVKNIKVKAKKKVKEGEAAAAADAAAAPVAAAPAAAGAKAPAAAKAAAPAKK